jgi:hypothetical protein
MCRAHPPNDVLLSENAALARLTARAMANLIHPAFSGARLIIKVDARHSSPPLSVRIIIVIRCRLTFAIGLFAGLILGGSQSALAAPQIASQTDGGARSQASFIEVAQAPAISPQQAPAQQPPATSISATPTSTAADEPVGNVATLTGNATVIRNQTSTPLKVQDDIFQNDVLQTAANSTLGITFNDATTFNLTANARITVDGYVYQDGGKQNAALFDVAKGTVAFVAASVARTGNMSIATPTATLGIRGTTGLIEVPAGASATGANNVAIKLYPDADGRVGHIDVSDRSGATLGTLTQGATGFTIRRGAGGRFGAVPLVISTQQALRDQGIVRQVHAAQNVGRQIVARQRALRQANPNRNNPRNNPAPQPGQQRQNSPQRPGLQQPGQERPGFQRPGLQRRPPPRGRREERR